MGLLIAAGLALAIPVVAITAASRAQPPTIAAGASASPGASGKTRPDKDKGPKKDRAFKSNNGNGGLKGNGALRGPITIRAISGSQVSLATEDGWSRTITVTSATVITKGGHPIAIGDLRVGDRIRFSQSRNADGSYAITAIAVPTPTARGVVTAVEASSITVKHRDGSTTVIHVSDQTTFEVRDKDPASLADIAVGDRVEAEGTLRADGSMDAVAVEAGPKKAPKVPKSSRAPVTSATPG
jgi:hypothetical protein